MNIRPVGTELFHADRRRDGQKGSDMKEIMAAFFNFANAAKTCVLLKTDVFGFNETRRIVRRIFVLKECTGISK